MLHPTLCMGQFSGEGGGGQGLDNIFGNWNFFSGKNLQLFKLQLKLRRSECFSYLKIIKHVTNVTN